MSSLSMLRLVFVICLVAGVAGAAVAADDAARTEDAVDSLMAPLLEAGAISGSVLIASGDDVLLAKGYGPADREHGVPNGPDTVFRLGSMTKQFTAAGILLLAQRGRLAPSDSLARFLPDYPRGDEITLHQLMSHTSGIPNYNGLEGYGESIIQPWTIDEVIAFFRDEPLRFEPGADWAYSNSGYVLLAKVIEVVSGRSYGDFLREEIFLPLGMESTRVDEFTDVVPHRATGYGNTGDGFYRAPYRNMGYTSGAGALLSTVRDLWRWDRALTDDRLLAGEWRDVMFAPVQRGYACGWFVREEGGRRLQEHRGAINGFLSQIARFPDDDTVVIALYNQETTFQIETNRQLRSIALGESWEPVLRPAAAVAPAELDRCAGRYDLGGGYFMELSVDDGVLHVALPEEAAEPAVPQGDDGFWVPGHMALVRLHRGENGEVSGLTVQQGARRHRAQRVPADG